MPQYGSTQNLISTNLSQTVDNQGNPIISSDTGFGASPLGYAARVQALFGLPNATFELTPPDTTAVISQSNQLPYWDIQDYSSGVMSGSAIYDSTTNTWGINLNPGTAAANDYITMTTRSYLVNDDNLSLRQQAISVVSKVGTYAGTTQWNLQLTASYYNASDTLLHSGTVATVYDNTTWTSMAGTTTTSGTAINAAAHYVDLTYKLTATAAVTSSTSVTIKSCLLSTTSAASKSNIVTETFTTSGTWTKPAGLTSLVAVIGIGAGGGGASGNSWWGQASQSKGRGSGGGGASRLAIARDVYIGTANSISIGIGSGGAGAAGGTITKTAAGTAELNAAGVNGSNGGQTTFGTYFTVEGGGGGSANTGTNAGAGGTAAGTTTTVILGVLEYTGGTGAAGGSTTGSIGSGVGQAAGSPGTAATQPFSIVSYLTQLGTVGAAGGTANASKTAPGSALIYTQSPSSAGTGANYLLGGGGATGGIPSDVSTNPTIGTSSNGGPGAGGAGGGFFLSIQSGTVTFSGTAGSGGSAGANTGAGGGAGGAAQVQTGTSGALSLSRGTTVAGNGGNGGSGLLAIVYIG